SEHMANRVMLVPDDRFYHVVGMWADQVLPIEGTARGGDPCSAPSAQHRAAQIDRKSSFQEHRSLGVCWAVSSCSLRAGCSENSQTGDGDPLAPRRIPSLLALEIETARWPTKDTAAGSSAHSRHEYCEPALGRTAHSWRTAQARHRCRANHCCQVHGGRK